MRPASQARTWLATAYDQVAFVPGLKRSIVERGVFDFDGVLFAEIWEANAPSYWRTCAKYYVSDHRPLWVRIQLPDTP